MNAITKNLNFCGIYMIINIVNSHRYIGSSVNIKKRLFHHRSNLRHNCHSNAHLQNAWNKYGEDNFIFTILEKCDTDVRFKREQYYVDTLTPEYNICVDVVENPPVTWSSREKHSATRKRLIAEGVIPLTNNIPIFVYKQDGSFVGRWDSIRKAAFALGLHPSGVYRCIKGIDFQCKGYRFTKVYSKNISPFERPHNTGERAKRWFIVTNVETGEQIRLLGREAVAKYLGTTTKTVGIYTGGKHKYNRKYMIYKDTAVS